MVPSRGQSAIGVLWRMWGRDKECASHGTICGKQASECRLQHARSDSLETSVWLTLHPLASLLNGLWNGAVDDPLGTQAAKIALSLNEVCFQKVLVLCFYQCNWMLMSHYCVCSVSTNHGCSHCMQTCWFRGLNAECVIHHVCCLTACHISHRN